VLIHFYSTRTTPTGPEASISLSEISTAITMRKWPESDNMPYRACEHNNGPPERWSLSESYCNPNQLCKKRLSPHKTQSLVSRNRSDARRLCDVAQKGGPKVHHAERDAVEVDIIAMINPSSERLYRSPNGCRRNVTRKEVSLDQNLRYQNIFVSKPKY